MSGRNQIDVLRPALLEANHDAGQLFGADSVSGERMGEAVVLAIDAFEAAPGEEDRSTALGAAYGRFLSVVQEGRIGD